MAIPELNYTEYLPAGVAALTFIWSMAQYFDMRKADKK